GQPDHLPGPRREPDLTADVASAGRRQHRFAQFVRRDVERDQRLVGEPVLLVEQAEEQVLGADVVVVERPCFVPGVGQHPPRSLCELVEGARHLTPPRVSMICAYHAYSVHIRYTCCRWLSIEPGAARRPAL